MSAEREYLVSNTDIKHFEKIRLAVSNLTREASSIILPGHSVLDVAPQDHGGIAKYLDPAIDVTTLDINPESGARIIGDICKFNPVMRDSSFDVVICTEVLEHVENPFFAMQEIFRVLKPGGRMYASSPFDFRLHGPLPDNWRITEHGWRILLREFSNVVIRPLENPRRFLMPIHYSIIAIK